MGSKDEVVSGTSQQAGQERMDLCGDRSNSPPQAAAVERARKLSR